MTACLFIIRASSYAPPAVPVFLGNREDFDRKLSSAISVLASGSALPVGFVALTALEKPPSGWLICDGTAQGRTAFPALYAALGGRYGAGDGATTFNIPTQAQCVAPAVAPTVPQVVVAGAVVPDVVPVVPDVTTNPTGGSGESGYVGGRIERFDFRFDAS